VPSRGDEQKEKTGCRTGLRRLEGRLSSDEKRRAALQKK